ncbi:MAG: nucleotidyltransferase domain-containing protein [Candidatus Celaenobacter polaris]|jgi:Nucleotidyltransferase domain.|nr:nucleotidyltransferase domain-containing protein [Candidatus Celaenobacter polaris]
MDQLAKILSSKTRAKIFALFFGINNEELHFREIQRRINLSVGTIKQEVDKLTSLDLLIVRKSRNRTYYKANTLHPLYKPIHDIVQKTNGLQQLLSQALTDKNIICAFIFGSYSSGTLDSESDIDLFVVGDITAQDLSFSLKNASDIIGREINYFLLSKNEFIKRKNANEHFVTSVLNSPINFILGEKNDLETMGIE